MEDINGIMAELQSVKDGTTELLKDTIGDYKRVNFRQSVTIWALIFALFAGGMFSLWLFSNQAAENDKRFKEFLSDYNFETVCETVTDGSDGGNATNYGGNINK